MKREYEPVEWPTDSSLSDAPYPGVGAARPADSQPIKLKFTLKRIFDDSDAHIWGPVVGWGSVFLAGNLCSRFLGIRRCNMGRFRRRLAGACTALGVATFWDRGYYHHARQYQENSDLSTIFHVTWLTFYLASLDPNGRKALLSAASAPLVPSLFARIQGPYFPPDATFAERTRQQLSWLIYQLWLSRRAKAAARFWFQRYLEDANLSPHDIETIITMVAQALDGPEWRLGNALSLCMTLCCSAARALARKHMPVTIWLNCLLAASLGSLAITEGLWPYHYITYPLSIHDKAKAAAALRKYYPEAFERLTAELDEFSGDILGSEPSYVQDGAWV
ncbi:hypothetical protein BKA93DRAFT_803262 [Sparassis latifolia]